MNIYEELRKSKHKNNNEYDKEWTVADLVRVFKEKVPDIKIDRNKINRIENGTQKPDVDLLIAYSTVFNVSIDYLLGVSNVASIDENLQMIGKVTGLTDTSIKMLKQYKDLYLDTLNYLIESNALHKLIKTIVIDAPLNAFHGEKSDFLSHNEYIVLRNIEEILKELFRNETLYDKVSKYKFERIEALYGKDADEILKEPELPED